MRGGYQKIKRDGKTPADGPALPLEADCHKGHQGIERTVIGVRR